MKFTTITLAAACAAVLAGCGAEGARKLPGVYRIDIQQGNVIEQEMLDRLQPGMDKGQVRFIMGTPAIVDPFHSDRWEYVYMYSKGGGRRQQRHITLHFDDDRLVRIDGDIVVAERREDEVLKPRAATVDVPLKPYRQGFFSRMFNALPFVGDDPPPPKPAARERAGTGAEDTARTDEAGDAEREDGESPR
jgi:outer membrane protein assembly factor BamE